MVCPACRGRAFRTAVRAGDIARQVEIRERLVRVEANPLSDRLRYTQNDLVDVACCRHCHTLQRDIPPAGTPARYADEKHARSDMQRLFDAYIPEYRCREAQYRGLLPPGANVLEVGSYVGAFLHVAREWGWNATGVDVNGEVAEFANAGGLVTRAAALEECAFGTASFDAAFVWNCFEQVPDPDSLLAEIARVLSHTGLLVIRTPNAVYYRVRAALIAAPGRARVPALRGRAVRALDHHNLLGFPFLYGYGPRSLELLAARNGFECTGPRPRSTLAWLEVSYRKRQQS